MANHEPRVDWSVLDRFVEQRMREARTPGLALALTTRDDLVHSGYFGHADPARRAPVASDTLFALGSVGKTFTALAVMQAVEAGRMELDRAIADYLPWFQVPSRFAPITLHHLLTHSAGIVKGTELAPDPRSMVWALRDTEASFAPGTQFHYSDTGYKALGLALEAVYGRAYGEIIRDGILEPLGLGQTEPAITHALRPRMATGYQELYDDRPSHASHPLVAAPWVETNSGDGCLASTAEDLAAFGRMLLRRGEGPLGRIVSEAGFARMLQPQVAEEEYGYGLYVFDMEGAMHIGHGGDMPGYEAYLWLDLDHGFGMALLAARPYPAGLSFRLLRWARAAFLGLATPTLPDPDDPTLVETPEQYVGSYRGDERRLDVVARDKELMADVDGMLMALEPHGPDRFYLPHPDFDLFPIQFERDGEAGGVVALLHGGDHYYHERRPTTGALPYPPRWDAYSGHYRSYNPWESSFRIVVRKGRLILIWPSGDEEPLFPVTEDRFRVGEAEHSPERLQFDAFVEGRSLTATLSGCPYYRFFTP